MATISPVSHSLAWYTTPKLPLPMTFGEREKGAESFSLLLFVQTGSISMALPHLAGELYQELVIINY